MVLNQLHCGMLRAFHYEGYKKVLLVFEAYIRLKLLSGSGNIFSFEYLSVT